jgi:hypothetical protein
MQDATRKDFEQLMRKLYTVADKLGLPRSEFALMVFAVEHCLQDREFLDAFGTYGQERLESFVATLNKIC